MPIKKLELEGMNPVSPLNQVIMEINDNLDAIVNAIDSVSSGGGVVGPQGLKGDTGVTGAPGPQGEQGPQGLPGKDGVDGKDGLQGVQGPTGANGKDGLQGAVGPKGDTGATGLQGPIGLTGPKGDTGAQGMPGKDGVSITSATVNSTGNLIITKSDGTTVDAGKVSSTAPTTTTTSGPPVVGSAPNPFAPIVVTAPQGYKAACLDDGVELSLDNIVVKLNTASPRSLQFKLSTGTISVNISGIIYWTNNGTGNVGSNYWQSKTLNTTWQQPFGWDFPWANDYAQYMLQDLTNKRYYRITLSIGPGYKNNFIVMERLV